ncbi:MAG: MotA/TolQ/ExbB proton channel family protein [Gemmatimonadaceae bacterium]|jgi:biopolymer transport protein TolQ|nr:MotA/TolQ/ExbB proton channel family protein [Gemmatimonadaceae bacterium]
MTLPASMLLQGAGGGALGLLAQGTPITWAVLALLVVLSAASWTIMLGKRAQFAAVERTSAGLHDVVRGASGFDAAASRADDGAGSPHAAVLARAAEFLRGVRAPQAAAADARPRLSPAQVEALQLVLDTASTAERDRLERRLPWLATIGAVSPLIGLFGTVIGVINAFLGVAAAGSGNIAAVAPGVAEALVATALALAVAIPAVFGFNLFAQRLNRLDGDLEAFGADIVALLVRDGRI